MKLTGDQFSDFEKALLSAYPTTSSLTRMVRFKLEEHLTQIAGGGNLTDIVFNLIIWAESEGKIRELITKSHEDKPGNLQLSTFASQFSDPQPDSSAIPSPNSSAGQNTRPTPPVQPTPPMKKMNLREMRQHLDQHFDDAALDGLCMLDFSSVYDKFTIGMRKDSKIMLLLDYCRRVDQRQEKLQRILQESSS